MIDRDRITVPVPSLDVDIAGVELQQVLCVNERASSGTKKLGDDALKVVQRNLAKWVSDA